MCSTPASIHLLKRDFIVKELLMLAWSASTIRTKAFKPQRTPAEKAAVKIFRRKMVAYIESELLPNYRVPCSEEQHLTHIEQLVKFGAQLAPQQFDARGYRFGIAQKFLNMVLKSLWVCSLIPEPPHCPVDRIMSTKAGVPQTPTWTAFTHRAQYMVIINAMRAMARAEGLSLAQWELYHFERPDGVRFFSAAFVEDGSVPRG